MVKQCVQSVNRKGARPRHVHERFDRRVVVYLNIGLVDLLSDKTKGFPTSAKAILKNVTGRQISIPVISR